MPVEYRSLVQGGFSSPNPFDGIVPISIRRKNPGAINAATWEKRYSGCVNMGGEQAGQQDHHL